MRKFNLDNYFAKGLMVVSGLAVLALALVGSFYLLIAAIVIAMSTSLISAVKGKPQPVRVKTNSRPLDAEYRVIRRK